MYARPLTTLGPDNTNQMDFSMAKPTINEDELPIYCILHLVYYHACDAKISDSVYHDVLSVVNTD